MTLLREYEQLIKNQTLSVEELVDRVIDSCNCLPYDEAKVCVDELNDFLINRLYISQKRSANLIKDAQTRNINKIGTIPITSITDKDGNNIVISIQNGIEPTEDFMSYVLSTSKRMLDMYPISVGLKEIRLFETFCPEDYEFANRFNMESKPSAATTNYKTGTINLWGISSLKMDPLILYHEYGHLIDKDLSTYDSELDNDYFKAITMDNSNIDADFTEDLAEAIALCFFNPKTFKEQYPNRYQVLVSKVSSLDASKPKDF